MKFSLMFFLFTLGLKSQASTDPAVIMNVSAYGRLLQVLQQCRGEPPSHPKPWSHSCHTKFHGATSSKSRIIQNSSKSIFPGCLKVQFSVKTCVSKIEALTQTIEDLMSTIHSLTKVVRSQASTIKNMAFLHSAPGTKNEFFFSPYLTRGPSVKDIKLMPYNNVLTKIFKKLSQKLKKAQQHKIIKNKSFEKSTSFLKTQTNFYDTKTKPSFLPQQQPSIPPHHQQSSIPPYHQQPSIQPHQQPFIPPQQQPFIQPQQQPSIPPYLQKPSIQTHHQQPFIQPHHQQQSNLQQQNSLNSRHFNAQTLMDDGLSLNHSPARAPWSTHHNWSHRRGRRDNGHSQSTFSLHNFSHPTTVRASSAPNVNSTTRQSSLFLSTLSSLLPSSTPPTFTSLFSSPSSFFSSSSLSSPPPPSPFLPSSQTRSFSPPSHSPFFPSRLPISRFSTFHSYNKILAEGGSNIVVSSADTILPQQAMMCMMMMICGLKLF